MQKLKVFLLLWMISGAMSIYAQYVFRHIDVTNGLSDNQVRSLSMTPDGLLSIRTTALINFYNGANFTYLRHNVRDTYNWRYPGVHKEYFDTQSRLWMIEEHNLSLLDLKHNQFVNNLSAIFRSWGIEATLRDFFVDASGNYWCLTEANFLFYYCIKTQDLIQVIDGNDDLIRKHGVPCEVLQQNDSCWIALKSGYLQCWDMKKGCFVKEDEYLVGRIKKQPRRLTIKSTSDNVMWVLYDRGVSYCNRKTGEWKDLDIQLSPDDLLTSMDIDKKGRIWIGSSKSGLRIVEPGVASVIHLYGIPLVTGETIHNDISSILVDPNDGVWIGLFNQGVCYYHESMQKFDLVNKRSIDLPDENIKCMLEDVGGSILLGTTKGLYRYFPQTRTVELAYPELANELCMNLYRDRHGRIWLGTFLGGVYCITGHTVRSYKYKNMDARSMPNYNSVRAMFEDEKGQMWISVYGGIGRFNPNDGSIRLLSQEHPEIDAYKLVTSISIGEQRSMVMSSGIGLYYYYPETDRVWIPEIDAPDDPRFKHSNKKYNCIYRDSRGITWYGTQDGLNIWNTKYKKLDTFYMEDGLPNNTIQGIVEDNAGDVWIATANGVCRVNIQDENSAFHYSFMNFTFNDGLQGGEFYERSAIKADNGTIYLGGTRGLNIFDPSKIIYNKSHNNIYFSTLKLFNTTIKEDEAFHGRFILKKPINQTDRVFLRYDENFVTLEFSGLNYVNPQQTYYKYILQGFDRDWTEVMAKDGLGRVTYTGLAPGTYTFRVYSANNDKLWGDQAGEITFVISPPFWATIYAYIVYFFLFIAAILGIIWYVTKRNKRKLILQQKEELDQMKYRFFTNISHEFRTPLTLIITPLETIIKKLNDEVLQKQLASVYHNAQELLVLVNQLLDFRKLEMKGEELQLTHGDMVEFVEGICHSFAEMSANKMINLNWKTSFENLYMYFDKDKVHKIINNILSNAFKFTPQGGSIWLNLDKRTEDGEDVLMLSVSDTGIGIPEKDLPHIFDRFYQVTDKRKEGSLGSGIGLHLIKEYVALHHGHIKVISKMGEGTTFTIFLPMDLRNEKEADVFTENENVLVIDSQKEKMSVSDKPTLLVVEDNNEFRHFMVEQLSGYFRVIDAPDGEVGEKKALDNSVDLIITDIMMPKVDGLELCRRIKTNIQTSHIPIILLTARTSDESRMSGYEAGADEYISKPFNFDMLLLRIRKLVEQQERRKEEFHRTIEVNPSDITITSLDEKLVQKALECVERNMDNPEYSVEDLSSDVGMHRMNLYRKLQSITGQTPTEFIRSIRLKRAAQLLVKGQLSVSEVADRVGFNTPKYFTKYFKEMFGVTPSQYTDKEK